MFFTLHLKKIPTVTAQMQRITFLGGRPVVYKDAKLKQAEELFCALLSEEKPDKPMTGPIRLTTIWNYEIKNQKKDRTYKTTKPDTDNLLKLFKDCMTRTGFWGDDAQVAVEITVKCWCHGSSFIYVAVDELGSKYREGI
jgi:Holliday junction resolvase RusA-like endonuclease